MVLKAIITLISEHKLALNMAQSKDQIQQKQKKKPMIDHHKQIQIKAPKKIKPTQRPQTTRVLECNKALTGVGATMAFNNQLEKGYWADLENIMQSKQMPIIQPESTQTKRRPKSIKSKIILTKTQLKLLRDWTMAKEPPETKKPPKEYRIISKPIKAISPTRLKTIALTPELTLELQKLIKK